MIKTSLKSQMCLEQAVMRLQTIHEFGDMASGMSMVKNVLGNIKTELAGKLPDISTGIGDVENSLENLTSDIGQAVDSDGVYVLANDESARILKEADLVAEQKMSQKFPEIPTSLTGSTRIR
jgi:division protein CdvB (Snf7/Vps24/ESCRT-III family)